MKGFSRVIKISDYDGMNYDLMPEHVKRDIVQDYPSALRLIAILTARLGGTVDVHKPEAIRAEQKRLGIVQPQSEKGGLGGDLQIIVF